MSIATLVRKTKNVAAKVSATAAKVQPVTVKPSGSIFSQIRLRAENAVTAARQAATSTSPFTPPFIPPKTPSVFTKNPNGVVKAETSTSTSKLPIIAALAVGAFLLMRRK